MSRKPAALVLASGSASRKQLLTAAGVDFLADPADLDEDALAAWSRSDFWREVHHPVHTVRQPLIRFVEDWVELVRAGAAAIPHSPAARSLVRERERRLKTAQSRFSNPAARDRWGGASGADRLSFRWGQAQSHLGDLLHGQ